jgi:hypothetical protein
MHIFKAWGPLLQVATTAPPVERPHLQRNHGEGFWLEKLSSRKQELITALIAPSSCWTLYLYLEAFVTILCNLIDLLVVCVTVCVEEDVEIHSVFCVLTFIFILM